MKLEKLLKNKFLILFLLTFICLLIVTMITGYKEGLKDYVNFSDYNTIDRIQIPNRNNDGYNHSYCIGGNIKCKSSTASLIDVSNGDYRQGKTYKSFCDDGTDVICADNLFSNVVSYNLSSYTLPEGTSFPLSEKYIGFTVPYNFVPVSFDTNNNFIINIDNSKTFSQCIDEYKSSASTTQSIQSNIGEPTCEIIHKCKMLTYDKEQECYRKLFSGGSITSSTSSSSKSTSSSSASDDVTSSSNKCSDSIKIPCVADFGTNIGEELCCGQTGVLQDTKYVCPISRPKCSNFKCGSQFGNCE